MPRPMHASTPMLQQRRSESYHPSQMDGYSYHSSPYYNHGKRAQQPQHGPHLQHGQRSPRPQHFQPGHRADRSSDRMMPSTSHHPSDLPHSRETEDYYPPIYTQRRPKLNYLPDSNDLSYDNYEPYDDYNDMPRMRHIPLDHHSQRPQMLSRPPMQQRPQRSPVLQMQGPPSPPPQEALPKENQSLTHYEPRLHHSENRIRTNVQSPIPPADPILSESNVPTHQSRSQKEDIQNDNSQKPIQASKTENSKAKKPPRPYTEYNIFFQLERERILNELEKEREANEKLRSSSADADQSTKKNEAKERKTSCDEIDDPAKLNQPSDPGDVLPRPPQFAHLKLSPYWYDSSYRLRQSKLTKNRRKHRKTHGLVGFLDLTRRIAKAWGEANEETKSYCKRVADRQLKVYKDELKQLKKPNATSNSVASTGALTVTSAASSPSDVAVESIKLETLKREAVTEDTLTSSGVHTTEPPRRAPHQEVREMHDVVDMRERQERHDIHDMPPPPPPPPPPAAPYKYHHNLSWQQQHPPPPPPAEQRGLRQRIPPRALPPRSCYPVIPQLTPTADYQDQKTFQDHCHADPHYPAEEGGGMRIHPLDELMYRRRMYGSKSAKSAMFRDQRRATQSRALDGRKRRKRGNATHKACDDYDLTTSKNNADSSGCHEVVEPKSKISTTEQTAPATSSYLSPANYESNNSNNKTTAITPSPSRRNDPSKQHERPILPERNRSTGSALPMKKRHKKLDDDNIIKGSPNSGSGCSGAPGMTPGSNASSSSTFTISPSDIMATPGGGTDGLGPFMPSPMSTGNSSYRKVLAPYISDSPYEFRTSSFPYIDCFSFQEGGPQNVAGSPRIASSPRMTPLDGGNRKALYYQRTSPAKLSSPPIGDAAGIDASGCGGGDVPSHLIVPGSYRPNRYPIPSFDYGATNDDFSDSEVLDLDEEEMQLMWRKLASHAKRRRRRVAAAWMNSNHSSNSSRAIEANGVSGNGVLHSPGYPFSHSFSSPVESYSIHSSLSYANPDPNSRVEVPSLPMYEEKEPPQDKRGDDGDRMESPKVSLKKELI